MEGGRIIWISIVVGLAISVAAGVWAWLPALSRNAGAYNVVAALRELEEANTAIGQANDSILRSLGDVQEQSERIAGVQARLRRLESGLKEQGEALGRLKAVTAGQAELSRSLEDLTAGMETEVASMAKTAAGEAELVESMSGMTARLSGQLGTIGRVNRSALEKLRRAEGLSATILDRLP